MAGREGSEKRRADEGGVDQRGMCGVETLRPKKLSHERLGALDIDRTSLSLKQRAQDPRHTHLQTLCRLLKKRKKKKRRLATTSTPPTCRVQKTSCASSCSHHPIPSHFTTNTNTHPAPQTSSTMTPSPENTPPLPASAPFKPQ